METTPTPPSTNADVKPEAPSPSPAGKTFYRRRALAIIDRRFQLRVTLMVVGVITVTQMLISGYIYFHASNWAKKVGDFVPDLETDAHSFVLMVLASILVTLITNFLFIFLLSIYFSAKISGPIFNMSRVFREVIEGNSSKRIQLRKSDELQEFAQVSNELLDHFEKKAGK